jgi:hypothetical protein
VTLCCGVPQFITVKTHTQVKIGCQPDCRGRERDPISLPFCELRRLKVTSLQHLARLPADGMIRSRPRREAGGLCSCHVNTVFTPRFPSRRRSCCRLTIPLAAYCRALSLRRPAQSVTRTIGPSRPLTLAQKTRHELQGHRGARKPIGILSKFSMMQSCPMSSAPPTPRHHRAHGHSVPVSPCIVAIVAMISWSVVEYPEARYDPCVGQRGSNGLRTSR